MLDALQFFTFNDQPATCPYCGSRTEEFSSFYHTVAKYVVEECSNPGCAIVLLRTELEDWVRVPAVRANPDWIGLNKSRHTPPAWRHY